MHTHPAVLHSRFSSLPPSFPAFGLSILVPAAVDKLTRTRNIESLDRSNVESIWSRFFAMQMLLPPPRETGRVRTCSQSDHQSKNSASALLGQTLAGRYKILKAIDASTFKGQDLVLDQTVHVREELRTPQGDRDIWRRKARELMLVRNPSFLNIIDVVCNGSSDFFISEYPRGRSIIELLGERSPLALDEILVLIRPLAGALDLIAASRICAASFSTRLVYAEAKRSFRCLPQGRSQGSLPQFNDPPSFFLKLDVWELIKPRKDIPPSLLGSRNEKTGSKNLAVCQMALLVYDLLGGETRQSNEVRHSFTPVKRLGKAANAILRRALRSSPFFKDAEGFLHKLESAIRSDTSQWDTRGTETCKNSAANPGTNYVLRRFDRDTQFLAAGLLSGVSCAALLIAASIPDSRYDVRRASKPESDLAASAEATGPFRIAPKAEKSGSLEMAINTDQKFAETSAKEDPPGTKTSTESTPSSPVLLGPDISLNAASLNQSKLSLRHQQDRSSIIREKTVRERSRSPGYPRPLDVKKQLIALWHKSLHQAEQARSWTISSKLNTKQKAAFIARTKR
jgi:hypothetical protein